MVRSGGKLTGLKKRIIPLSIKNTVLFLQHSTTQRVAKITRLRSVALTNKPNLTLLALNSQDEWGEVAQALGVESISSPQDVLKALNREKQSTANKIVDEVIAQAIFCPAPARASYCNVLSGWRRAIQGVYQIQLNTFGKMVNTTKGHRDYSKMNNSRLNESQVAVCRNTGGE
ncbi:Mu-like prophage I protein [Klebsiella pneumoniae subsp. ozaenae]|uniref:Mu-like prophage I protein n=1 Tax=Klebsiella pneumoniae subsp. ozaenae TaxID=574 RepID=A0A377YYX3_KLEPO|nr:Mu-like prophage I protein [Klebsiella pneumoniae subsp. ozaenae]